ncbi:MAG: PHP domain-containing protein [Butyrivibrio sp.]|nr:PHP domain-containing protein [Butyrivibrio sp.]
MEYIYETHLHTVEASACGVAHGADYINYMLGQGYSGIIVTDHFFNGNSAVPKDLPWSERVELYCKGYEQALEASKGTDLNVMFGIEYNFQGDEYLLYGVDKEWLLANPDIMEKDRHQVYEAVHNYGGIMVQAHPYRERGYLSAIHLTPSVCDGAEVYNSGNDDYQNALGYEFAVKHGFTMSSGSDIHAIPQDEMGGMSFPYKINNIREYVEAFKKGDGTPVFKKNAQDAGTPFIPVASSKEQTVPTKGPTLEVVIHD